MAIKIGRSVKSQADAGADPFNDLLFNSLLGISLLFFVSILFVNPDVKSGEVQLNAYFVITVTWKDYSPDDVDVWVEDPQGNKLWFRQREVGLLHLDRDDRGMKDDKIKIEEQFVENPLNQEVVTIRGVYPGRYTVNVHYYKSETKKPVEALVRIFKLRPDYQMIFDEALLMEREGVEKTAINFTIGVDGQIKQKNRQPRALVFNRR